METLLDFPRAFRATRHAATSARDGRRQAAGLIRIKDRITLVPKNAGHDKTGAAMPRWEFHLSPDDTHTASRWAWMYRYDGGDTITSTGTFGTYDECMIDAVLHGYSAADIGRHREQAQADAALRNTHRSA